MAYTINKFYKFSLFLAFGWLLLISSAAHGQSFIPRISLSPDGGKLVFSHCPEHCGIAELDIKTQEAVLFYSKTISIQAPSYAQDGMSVVASYMHPTRDAFRNIVSFNLSSLEASIVTNGKNYDFSPSYCGNKNIVVFARALNRKTGRIPFSNFDIYLAEPYKENKERKITDLRIGLLSSPVCIDNDIAYSAIDGREKLYRVHYGEIKPHNSSSILLGDFTLQGSSSIKKQLIAIRRMNSAFSLVVLESDGFLVKELPVDGYVGRASISDNGRFIAYVKGRDYPEIIVVDLNDGSNTVFRLQDIRFNKHTTLEMSHVNVH